MLYKLGRHPESGIIDSVKPVPFEYLPKEKELEDLLAKNLLEIFFEDELMPVFQERAWQEEADIYALDRQGNLVVFELKRGGADSGAVHQALRYCEKASRWTYETIQSKLAKYNEDAAIDLQQEHQEVFGLDEPLTRSSFNQKQHLIIVGSAGDDRLVENVEYWKSKGIWLDFVPYRVYQIATEYYFEFFSIPYDRHLNPADFKGVIFDTCRSHFEESIWYMCENRRVAAFGDQSEIVHYLGRNDVVFLCHKHVGIVAAGKVISEVRTDTEHEEKALYRDLEWLTPVPVRGQPLRALTVRRVREILEHNFFWARTIKTPYLKNGEVEKLLVALRTALSPVPVQP